MRHASKISTRDSPRTKKKYCDTSVYLFTCPFTVINIDSYWGKHAFQPISNAMTGKRFEEIKRYLCFQDESKPVKKGETEYDPLTIRYRSNERFDTVPKTARFCVDEQMCRTKIKHHLRQYMPNKPHKWGIKLFVLCDSHGFTYRFEIYCRAGDNVVLPEAPVLGCTANVVVRLSKTIPVFAHHILYFDNFYTSLPLLVYLRARGIYSLGTVRLNRISNFKLPDDKEIAIEARGYSTEYVGKAYGVDIYNVLWKDSKNVRLASTYVGTKPFDKANTEEQVAKAPRYDRKKKKFIEVDCPQIIREYNSHMGGVDLMDGFMGRYHNRTKSLYHFIDMAATNAFILSRRAHTERCMDSSNSHAKVLQLPQFREEIAAGLVSYQEQQEKRKVGRPSHISSSATTQQPEPGPSSGTIGHKTNHPAADTRYDGLDHFPVWLGKADGRRLCKLCKKSQTQCMCQKLLLRLSYSQIICFSIYFFLLK